MADDPQKNPDPASAGTGTGTGDPGTGTPAFVEIILPRAGTTIPAATAKLRIEIFSTQPGLNHYVQFFKDVSHTLPPNDTVPGTDQAQVVFGGDPAYPNIGTAFLIPPAAAAATTAPNYLLTCWVGGDINLRYTGTPFLNQMPERVVLVAGPVVGGGGGGGPTTQPPPSPSPTI